MEKYQVSSLIQDFVFDSGKWVVSGVFHRKYIINHCFSRINVCQILREMFKTEEKPGNLFYYLFSPTCLINLIKYIEHSCKILYVLKDGSAEEERAGALLKLLYFLVLSCVCLCLPVQS